MHAGDALWQLWGLAAHLRKHGSAPAADFMEARLDVIGECIKVGPPGVEALAQLSSALESLTTPVPPIADDGMAYASEQPEKKSGGKNNAYSEPELVAAAMRLTDEMVDSEQFGWAKLVDSIVEQLAKDGAFITPKQCKALKNIAAGKDFEDEGTFWDWFCNEWPEASKLVGDAADSA
jgi:hypothetical protein